MTTVPAVLIDAHGTAVPVDAVHPGSQFVDIQHQQGGTCRFVRIGNPLPDGRLVFGIQDDQPPYVLTAVTGHVRFRDPIARWPSVWQEGCRQAMATVWPHMVPGTGAPVLSHRLALVLKPGPNQFAYALTHWVAFRQAAPAAGEA